LYNAFQVVSYIISAHTGNNEEEEEGEEEERTDSHTILKLIN
jgi:hypothetical protein